MNVWVFIYRTAWTALIILGVVGLVAAFAPKVRQLRDLQKKETRLEEEIRYEDDLLRNLKTKQERLQNDPRFAERIAREELGLAKPGETVFKFMDDAQTNARGRNQP